MGSLRWPAGTPPPRRHVEYPSGQRYDRARDLGFVTALRLRPPLPDKSGRAGLAAQRWNGAALPTNK